MDPLGTPRHLHTLHEFEQEGQTYLADLEEGIVIPVSKSVREILRRCESQTRAEIVAELEDVFEKDALREAFTYLEALDARGLLFGGVAEIPSRPLGERFRLCVSPRFLLHKTETGVCVRWVHYHLISALTRHAEVALLLPKLEGEDEEDIPFLTGEDVERIPVESWAMEHLLRAAPTDCDGLLLFSPPTPQELMWYHHAEMPVVSYVQSETLASRKELNVLLQHAAAMRDCDALVTDAPWVFSAMDGIVSRFPVSVTLPPGTDDLTLPAELDRTTFLTGLQAQFPGKRLGAEAFVGVSLDRSLSRRERLLPELCLAHPDWTFVAFHPLAKTLLGSRIPNLLCLDLFTHEDLLILATFTAQMDAFAYQPGLGASALPLMMARSAGCPVVFYGEEEECGAAFGGPRRTAKPAQPQDTSVESLSSAISACLTTRRKGAESLTTSWDTVAQRLLDVFRACLARQAGLSARCLGPTKPLFHYHYVKSSGSVEVTASLLPGFTEASVEDALKLALAGEHSENEIQAVLRHLRSRRQFHDADIP